MNAGQQPSRTSGEFGTHQPAGVEPRRNIEIKARVADAGATRALAQSVATEQCGVIRQIDTYFHAPQGRLKLREAFTDEGEPREAQLVSYGRADARAARTSEYHLIEVAAPAELKAALAAALGVKTVVRKRREVLLFHNVRIHLDAVEGLGTFLELEAVVGPDADEPTSRQRLDFLQTALHIRGDDLLPGSYSDML